MSVPAGLQFAALDRVSTFLAHSSVSVHRRCSTLKDNAEVRAKSNPPGIEEGMKNSHRVWKGILGIRNLSKNRVRDPGKRKISCRDSGFDCYPESGIRQNLGTGCGIFLPVCREFGNSFRPKQTF